MFKNGYTNGRDKTASAIISPEVFYRNNRASILANNPSQSRVALYDLMSSKLFSRISLLVVAMNTAFIIFEYFLVTNSCQSQCVAGTCKLLLNSDTGLIMPCKMYTHDLNL